MKKKAVIARMYLADKRPIDIAVELNVSRQMVSKVISGKGKSRRIANRIAKLLGSSAAELWPHLYGRKAA